MCHFFSGKSDYNSWDKVQPDNSKGDLDRAYNNFRKRQGHRDYGTCSVKIQFTGEDSDRSDHSMIRVLYKQNWICCLH